MDIIEAILDMILGMIDCFSFWTPDEKKEVRKERRQERREERKNRKNRKNDANDF